MNYNSAIIAYRSIISNCSNEKSFQSKIYTTHTKQLEIGVSSCIYRIYSQESNIHKEIKDDNRAKCFSEGGQWITKAFFADWFFFCLFLLSLSAACTLLWHEVRIKKSTLHASSSY